MCIVQYINVYNNNLMCIVYVCYATRNKIIKMNHKSKIYIQLIDENKIFDAKLWIHKERKRI